MTDIIGWYSFKDDEGNVLNQFEAYFPGATAIFLMAGG